MRQFLTNCEKIEYLAATAYRRLAANRGYDSHIRETFQALNKDEMAHARLVNLIQHLPGQDLEIVGQMAQEDGNVSLIFAQALLEVIDKENLTEVDALLMAIDLEKCFIKFHVNNAIDFHNPRIARLFKKLGHADQKHLDRLLSCLHWWGKIKRKDPSKMG